MSTKTLKTITQILLLSVIAIVPFLKTTSLYFPYVSGKVYVFRLLVALAFFFWVWLMLNPVRGQRGLEKTQRKQISNGVKEKEYPSTSLGASKLNFKNILVISLVLFFLAQALASFFGVDPFHSFFSGIERADGVLQYGFWILYFLMLVSVFRKEQDWKLLFYVFIIAAVLLSLYSWFNYSSQIRLYGIFGNPSYFAAYLLFAIGFCAIAIERRFVNDYFLNGLFFLSAIFFVVTLIFTQTRGGYAGLVGGIFLFCLLALSFLRKENKKLALYCGVILLLGLISIAVLFSTRETDFVKNRHILKRTTSIIKIWEEGAIRERILNWQIALKAFKERPIFGWGPENFGSAANKYYDYRIGRGEPWFDRAHNQPLDTLATGGIAVFSFYLFWLAAAVFLIFRIARQKKVLSFILASIFLAYFIQGLFLFDLLAVYLGLFPFLGFLIFEYNSIYGEKKEEPFDAAQGKQKKKNNFNNKSRFYILIPTACFSLFVIYATCFIPYKANALTLKFYAHTEYGIYKEVKPFLEQAFSVKSPYTFWEVRKRAGWQFVNVLEYGLKDTTSPDDIQALKEIYDFITPELERFAENKPYDPQIYYVLGKVYRFGYEKLGYNDLDKAERILKKAFNYSDLRVDYFNEFGQVLLLQGKFEEAEKSVKDYVEKVSFYEYFPYVTLGHFYFVAGKYDLAMEQYEKARETGYKFYENSVEYSRYMFVAEEVEEYQKVADMAENYLEKWGPDADTFFNIAVGYLNLEEKEKAKEFFLKALELDKEQYEEYRPFFLD